MTSETLLCAVCDESVKDARLISECIGCSRSFHLNPYSGGDYKDCGDALIGPTQGVEFWCRVCIEQVEAEMSANPPDQRAMLDQLAAPGGTLVMSGQAPSMATPQAPTTRAAESGATSKAGAPPPRRARAQPPKRYRRIDG
jgi:hypothetical protein